MPHAKVFVQRITSTSSLREIADGTARLLSNFDLPRLFGGKSVLVKPNLCGEQLDGNTDPRVIYGVVKALESLAAKITVGDGSIVGVETAAVIKQLGLVDLLKDTKAEIIDFKSGRYFDTGLPGAQCSKQVMMAEAAATADAIISLAKLKTHTATGVSLSIKNLKGTLHEYDNLHFHHVNLTDCLVDMISTIRPALCIVDGLFALDAHGEGKVALDCLIAGEDPVAVDAASARAIGVDPANIYAGTMNESHIKKAAERGVGEMNDIEIIGALPNATFTPPPASLSHLHMPEGMEIIDGNPCAACIGMLAGVLQKLKPDGKPRKTMILVGPKAPPPGETAGRTIIIGNCLHRLQSESESSTFIIGCPPNGTYDVLPILES